MKKGGFIFIETIIVVCVLTVGLMSLYGNYSKMMKNTKELNTFDTAEYNYKTYFLMKNYSNGTLSGKTLLGDNTTITSSSSKDKCYIVETKFSEGPISPNTTGQQAKICILQGVSSSSYLNSYKNQFDAYIIDYLNSQDLTTSNDNLFLVEYKKLDKINSTATNPIYYTYISSLNY